MIKVSNAGTLCPAEQRSWHPQRKGFTLLEIIVVVVILMIAAVMTVPLMSSGAGTKTLAAAQMVAADLEYARSMAFTRGHIYRVTFDTGAGRYQVEDQDGVVVAHPVNRGSSYIVKFAGGRLDGGRIDSVSFDGTVQVRFDALGSPYNGHGTPLNSGVVTLQAGSHSQTVHIEPVTGLITVDD